ncbi:hypothetical protein DPMN_100072 [Dreissena polymorpha]|uniref:Uncharacterized protein n=1 Tax=Dreissena polymorpha TaxID=45954 RepID=A0A9D4LF95_DREPO|nr:hypothetical protein DPMN_100072 [Dreissena polymorpha]
MDELYCLSSDIPAEPEAAANLLEALDIGYGTMEAFISDRRIAKIMSLDELFKRNKLDIFDTSEVSKTS